jgi:hypothetical protein
LWGNQGFPHTKNETPGCGHPGVSLGLPARHHRGDALGGAALRPGRPFEHRAFGRRAPRIGLVPCKVLRLYWPCLEKSSSKVK